MEAFNVGALAEQEGLTLVAETDDFEFPVDAIIGHALITAGGVGADAIQLPLEFRRSNRPKRTFQFLLQWTNYAQPTWVPYSTACKLVQFPGYVVNFPNLNMSSV